MSEAFFLSTQYSVLSTVVIEEVTASLEGWDAEDEGRIAVRVENRKRRRYGVLTQHVVR